MFAAFETAPSENPHSCRQKGESAFYEYVSCPLSPPEATVESLISIFIIYIYMTVGQKSWTKKIILGGHNRHFYMILQVRYVASRKGIPQNTS